MSNLTQVYTDTDAEILGDCYRTALACLLGLDDPQEAPHFVAMYDGQKGRWWTESVAWVEEHRPGWTMLSGDPVFPSYTEPEISPKYLIGSGPSPRGDWMHCVLLDAVTGDMVWDPHPSRDGLAGPPLDLILLVPSS